FIAPAPTRERKSHLPRPLRAPIGSLLRATPPSSESAASEGAEAGGLLRSVRGFRGGGGRDFPETSVLPRLSASRPLRDGRRPAPSAEGGAYANNLELQAPDWSAGGLRRRAPRRRGNAGKARARVSDDGDAGQPGQELRLPAQVPAGGRQRRGQGRDPGEPAGRRGRVPIRLQQRDRLQDNHHPAGRPTGQTGALGILLVYDITNRWSFDGIDRWIKEIDEHAPGVPRILVGNRLHLAFKRQVPTEQARAYAEKNCMTFFEVSPLCNFNVIESFTELSRIVLMRHGMEKIWRPNRVFSLQDLCCRAIVSCTPVHLIDKLPLPVTIKSHLKSFSMANGMNAVMMHGRSYSLASGAGGGGSKGNSLKRSKSIRPPQSPPQNCSRSNCKIS
uniref:small monomeric GTPase n=1 Tax=Moschus moschiferus TaxID=68415 RepID=A0A8C6FI83_MOSMO